VPREALAPLVRATVENWARDGAADSLTGPIARGDEQTVERQREAIAQRAPELLPLFDAVGARARLLAGRTAPAFEPRLLRSVAELRAAVAQARAGGRTVGLVPTMGALHEGHLSLIGRARADHGLVVVSAFVNPAQFDDAGDLAAYPRDEARDAQLAFAAGADVLFAPAPGEIYPEGFCTTVSVGGTLTGTLEGEHRGRSHFDGVTTVVAKLLAMATPDAAYFGQKDAQQAAVVRRMARDLDIPCQIVICPIVRDADGLALSSRNARLSQAERRPALSLSRALSTVAEQIAAGRIETGAAASRAGLAILREGGAEPEYFTAVDPTTLVPAGDLHGTVLLLAAARIGEVRLIDNLAAHAPRLNGPHEAATALAAPTAC
jgi:pantoate--beta-alanine ligase